MEEGNKNLVEGNKKLIEINDEAKTTVDRVNSTVANLTQLGKTFGLDKAGNTINDHLFKKTPSTTPTVENLQKEINELKKQLEECNNKLKSKST